MRAARTGRGYHLGMDRIVGVEDDDRLAGVWLRPGPDPTFYAPVSLPSGALAICRVVITDADDHRRRTRWAVYGRDGKLLGDDLEPAAVAAEQALAAVERVLVAEGIPVTAAPGE